MLEATNESPLKTAPIHLPRSLHRFAVMGLVGFAVSVSMGAALISLFKLWVLLAFGGVVWAQWRSGHAPWSSVWPKSMAWLIALWAWMLVSAIWSSAETREQALAFDRYSRLLVLPVAWHLMNQVQAQRLALRGFLFGQLLVLLSSYALLMGWPVPWATARFGPEMGVVFTSTLEQPVMMGLMAWVLFQCGDAVLPPRWKNLKWALIALTLLNVFLFSSGRSGYVAGGLVVFLMAVQIIPKRMRGLSLLVPVLVLICAFTLSPRVQERVTVVFHEVSLYLQSNHQLSEEQLGSQGARLNYWARSLDMVRDQPIFGVGLGAWRTNYLKYGGLQAEPPSNPHQQYLLMATEGGLVALLLLLGWMLQLWRDAAITAQPMALRGVVWVAALIGLFNCPFYGIGMGEMLLLLFALLLHQPPEGQA